ncbi:MAG: DUF2442 domain-containing protein [Bacteriovoracaceae bacterium]|nr:DUF2442 domain-containing protein [Bacteriovoracaceae bacterium]
MKKLGNKITEVLSVSDHDFAIELIFSDGYRGTVSLGKIFSSPKGEAAEVLKGQIFSKCFVESGSLAWPNGFELCPDAIRIMIEEQLKDNKAS